MDIAIQELLHFLIPILGRYIFPALVLNIGIDCLKLVARPLAGALVLRTLALGIPLAGCVALKFADGMAWTDALIQGATVGVLAVLAYDLRLYTWARDKLLKAMGRP